MYAHTGQRTHHDQERDDDGVVPRTRVPAPLKRQEQERHHRHAQEGPDVVQLAPLRAPGTVGGREIGQEDHDKDQCDATALKDRVNAPSDVIALVKTHRQINPCVSVRLAIRWKGIDAQDLQKHHLRVLRRVR